MNCPNNPDDNIPNEEGGDAKFNNWDWVPGSTPLDPYGMSRTVLLNSLRKLKASNGAFLVKAALLAITHMMALTERLFVIHKLGSYAVPDRNYKESASAVIKKRQSQNWPTAKGQAPNKNNKIDI